MAIRAVCCALLLSTLSTAAIAGGMGEVGPDATVGHAADSLDWGGLHFSVTGALPFGQNAWEEPFSSSGVGGWSGSTTVVSGGFDFQTGNLVLGVEVSKALGEVAGEPFTGRFYACDGCMTNVADLTRLTVRAGIAHNKNLFYVTAGAAKAHVIATSPGRNGDVYGEGDMSGWTAGIGAEHALTDHFFLTGEVSLTDLGTLPLPGISFPGNFTDVRFGLVELGISYRW